MTILERLAATTDPVWVDMINRRRTPPTSGGAAGNEGLSSQPGAEWGRKGGSHYKDDEFTKKA